MQKFKAFLLKNKVAILACSLMAILGFGYWVLGNSNTTTIGEDITVGNDLIVNGNVGIGTTDPQAKLDVAGRIRFQCSICLGWADWDRPAPERQQCFNMTGSGRNNSNYLQLGGDVDHNDRLWLWMQCP